jgi:hypothetical protein
MLENLEKSIRKAMGGEEDIGTQDNSQASSTEETTGTNLNQEALLAEQVIPLLTDGSLEVDQEKIKDWAMAQGLLDEDAYLFAADVISAYLISLVEQVVPLLNDGSLEVDQEKIKDWAMSQGLTEDSADLFAVDVISAYLEEDEDDEEEDEEVEKSAIRSLKKMEADIYRISQGIEILGRALEVSLAIAEQNRNDVALIKSKLGIIQNTSVNPNLQ